MSSGRKGRLHVHPCRREAQRRAAWSLAWAVGLSVALVGAASSQDGAVPAGRTFYAPFDGSLEAAEAGGEKLGRPEGKPAFAPGHKGQGLVVGDLDGAAGALYQTERNFSVERGTVALWVQPLNWRGDDDLHHLFFQAWPEAWDRVLR